MSEEQVEKIEPAAEEISLEQPVCEAPELEEGPQDGVHAMRRSENLWLFKVGLMVFLTVACCILFFFLVYRYKGFASGWGKLMKAAEPIIIGLILAYLLNPVMKAIESSAFRRLSPRLKSQKRAKKLSRGIGIVVSIMFLISILTLIVAAVGPALISSVSGLVEYGSEYVKNFIDTTESGILGHFEVTEVVGQYLTTIIGYVQKWAEDSLLPRMQGYIGQVTSSVISMLRLFLNFIIGIIVAVYVMVIQEELIGQSKKLVFALFKPKTGNMIVKGVRKADEIFGGFIVGKIIDSAIIGVICYLGCMIMRIPDAMLVAVVIGVTNIIPVFGPFIGAVPSLILVVIQSPWHALYLLIFILVLQQVDGNIIGPKILGNSTGLSSFWVMFAILIGGGLFGFFGMLLGVPVFAMIYYILRVSVNSRIRKRGLPPDTGDYLQASGVDEEAHALIYPEESEEKKGK